MNYEIYLDESGNTGNPKFKSGKWNFQEQPYFALGSLCVRQEIKNSLEKDIQSIFTKYDKDLGICKELKSTAKYKFKDELLKDIIDILLMNRTKLYFDISNKKYKIIMNIVDYCIYPYYNTDLPFDNTFRNKKLYAATQLYNKLSDDIIQNFIDICIQNLEENEDESYLEMLKFFLLLINSDIDMRLKNQIENTKKCLLILKERGLPARNIYPIQDLTNKDSNMSFLPNLDAFLNTIASTANIKLSSNDKLFIFHDEQKQFSKSLIKWVDKMKSEASISSLQHIVFVESKKSVLIQAIDFLTGTILKCFKSSLNDPYSKRNRKLLRIMKPIVQNCNIVSVESEYMEFFKQSNIKYGRAPVPFDGVIRKM